MPPETTPPVERQAAALRDVRTNDSLSQVRQETFGARDQNEARDKPGDQARDQPNSLPNGNTADGSQQKAPESKAVRDMLDGFGLINGTQAEPAKKAGEAASSPPVRMLESSPLASNSFNPSGPHVETKANGDVVESYSRYGEESHTVTTKPDKTKIIDTPSAGTKQTNYPDGRITKEFEHHAFGLKKITVDTNGDVTKDYSEGRPEGMTQTIDRKRGDSFERETTYKNRSDGLQKNTEFDSNDKQKRTSVQDYEGKKVTNFQDGAPAQSITEFKKDRADGVKKVVDLPNGERELHTKDGRMKKDGVEKQMPVDPKNKEGLTHVTERHWKDLEPKNGPGNEQDHHIRTSEFKGRKDGMVREIDVKNGVDDNLDKIADFKGRTDGLQQRVTYHGGADRAKQTDVYADREVTQYEKGSKLQQWTQFKNPGDGQVSGQMKFSDGRTITDYNGRPTVVTGKDGKPEL